MHLELERLQIIKSKETEKKATTNMKHDELVQAKKKVVELICSKLMDEGAEFCPRVQHAGVVKRYVSAFVCPCQNAWVIKPQRICERGVIPPPPLAASQGSTAMYDLEHCVSLVRLACEVVR